MITFEEEPFATTKYYSGVYTDIYQDEYEFTFVDMGEYSYDITWINKPGEDDNIDYIENEIIREYENKFA